jgi:hypothetical protein
MKKLFSLFLFITASLYSYCQVEITSNWISFVQSVDASFLKKEIKFKLMASVKVVSGDSTSRAGLWVRVDKKVGGTGYFNNMRDRPIRSNQWNAYTIEGIIDANPNKLNFGGICYGNGQFFFDHFKLFVENDKGILQEALIENPSFEKMGSDNFPEGWSTGISVDNPVKIKGYSFSIPKDAPDGNQSLLIEGKGVEEGKGSIIEPVEGYSPQIGTLVSMLNDLSDRVEEVVYSLNQEELDHLLDEKARLAPSLCTWQLRKQCIRWCHLKNVISMTRRRRNGLQL